MLRKASLNSEFTDTYKKSVHVFYKHIKFRIQALRLCLAIYDFEVRIMLSFSRYQITRMRKI